VPRFCSIQTVVLFKSFTYLHCVAGRIAELEKDLYYYKTTSREFKKKLRSVNRDSMQAEHDIRQNSTEPAVTHRDIAAAGDSALRSSGWSKHHALERFSNLTICDKIYITITGLQCSSVRETELIMHIMGSK